MSATSLRRWAALHAASLPPDQRQTPPAVRASRDFDLAPTVLASCTEVNSWNLGSDAYALALAQQDGAVLMATGGHEEKVRIWEPTAGSLVRELTGHSDRIWSATFGHGLDGRLLLATGSADGTARIWSPQTGAALNVLSGHTMEVAGVAWGHYPDGQPFLTTIDRTGTGRIWDPTAGQVIHTLTGQGYRWWNAATGYRADRRAVLAIGQSDDLVSIWDPSAGQLEGSCSFTVERFVSSVGWGNRPGRDPLLAAAAGDEARIWVNWGNAAADERTYFELSPGTGQVLTVGWAPLADGRTLLATTTSGALHLWDGATGQCLHTERYRFGDGFNHLDWVFGPGGELLLAAASTDARAHLWDVRLEPQAEPSPASVPPSRERPSARAPRPVTILDPPEEVTPDFPGIEGLRKSIERVSNVERHGDHVVVAAVAADGEIQIWDVSTGALLRVITNPAHSQSVAIESTAGRSARLAVGGNDGTARIWDLDTGSLLHTLTRDPDEVSSVAWGYGLAGQPSMLATGDRAGVVSIWDADTGQLLRTLTGHTGSVSAAAWGYRDGGQRLLATGGDDNTARIWDPDAGQLLRIIPGHARVVWSVAWGQASPGYPPVLATGGDDATVWMWNPDTGRSVRTLAGHTDTVFTLAWAALGDGRPVLASAGADSTARIWDPETGDELASVPSDSLLRHAFALYTGPEGDLRMAVADRSQESGPFRVWRIATGVGPIARQDSDSAGHSLRWQAAELSGWLLRIGGVGLWPPLGLLADLVDLTARTPMARDGRLAGLADEPAIARLRALGWEPAARVAFAALIASGLTAAERYAPPADATPAALRDGLARALAERGDAARPSPVPVGEVRAAAGLITDRTLTLLTILGPTACAADPLLPVRLAHRITQLPALTPRELRLLAPAGRRSGAVSRGTAAGTMVYSPGTAGLARTGPLTRLLPTQLALPGAMLTMRIAENELLYREHRAPAPPAPQPVTIILDTTPPTYGPAGITLRLAAHLMTAALWDHDRPPSLITLGEPAVLAELRTPADLIRIWTSSTLDEPAAALATALATASEVGQPVVFASHFQTARDCGYRPGPVTRLLTAHHPPEQPPSPAGRWHQHLPPAPTDAQLTAAISSILSPAAEGGN